MKLETKRIVIMILAIITIFGTTANLVLIGLHFAGLQEYPISEVEGLETTSITSQAVCYGILEITSIVILILIGKLEKHKISILLLTMIQFLFGNVWLAVIMIIVLNRKTIDIEEKNIELPETEVGDFQYKKLAFILFIVSFIIGYTPLINYLLEIGESNLFILFFIMIISIEVVILPFLIVGKELRRNFKVFRKNFKTYMEYIIPKVSIFMIVFVLVSVALSLIVGENSTNQEAVNELSLIILIPLSLIYAPIAEEVMFRGFLRKGFKSSKLFVIASTIIFGYIHVATVETNVLQYLYIILYGLLGYFLAKIYDKTNNIYASIFTHFLWNLIGVISSVLMLI